ncbi:MAG: HEAT repeat domain-containing protein [Acidobacteriota bacterium]
MGTPGDHGMILDGRESIGELISLLGHSNLRVRRSAIAALVEREPSETLPGVLAALGDQENAAARSAAGDVLLRYGQRILEPLTRTLDPDGHRDRTIQLLDILACIPARATVKAVIPLASHPDPSVAASAISCLGTLRDPSSVPTLLEVLDSQKRWQTFYAIDALGEVGHAAAVNRLVPLIKDPYYRKAVLRALGKIGDESAVGPLVEALAAGTPPPDRTALASLDEMVERSRSSLGRESLIARIRGELRIRQDAALIDGLAQLLREGAIETRCQAARVLGWMGGKEVAAPLVHACGEPFLADTAAQALQSLEGGHVEEILDAMRSVALSGLALCRLIKILAGTLTERTEQFFIMALEHEEEDVRQAAAAALARAAEGRYLEILVRVLGDPAPLVSSEAVKGLTAIAERSEALREHVAGRVEGLTASPSPEMRGAALQVIARLHGDGAGEILDLALHDPVAVVRRTAVALLGEDPDPDRLWRLSVALADEDSRVREEAVHAVGRLQDQRARGVLLSSLHDRSPWVRCRAARALSDHPAAEVRVALEQVVRNDILPVKVAAIEALASLWPATRDFLVEGTRSQEAEIRRACLVALARREGDAPMEVLAGALEDPAWPVRCAAAEALGASGDAAAFEPVSRALDRERDGSVRRALIGALYHLDAESALPFLIAGLSEKDIADTAGELLVRGRTLFADELRAEWASEMDPAIREGLAVVLEEVGRREAQGTAAEEGGPS